MRKDQNVFTTANGSIGVVRLKHMFRLGIAHPLRECLVREIRLVEEVVPVLVSATKLGMLLFWWQSVHCLKRLGAQLIDLFSTVQPVALAKIVLTTSSPFIYFNASTLLADNEW